MATQTEGLDKMVDSGFGTPRKGTTTHGKQKGVTYIIKAFHTNEGVDSSVELEDNVVNHINNQIENKVNEQVTNEVVKDIYNDIIEGEEIDQTVIDKYGTEILKYPLGKWRIVKNSISDKFSDLPVKTSGRIEITSIDVDINKNPWNNSWCYRAYNFETHNDTNYLRKLNSGDIAGVSYDTGWQKIATQKD